MTEKLLPAVKNKITIGRFEIPFRVYGNGNSYLVCLNGAQQSMAMWLSFARRFSDGYRIVLFDFPNQGKARILNGPQKVSLDEQVNVLYGVLEALRVGSNATICTASWGGIIALLFAVKYPYRVKRLILSGIGTKPNAKMIEAIKKGLSIDIHNRDEMAKVVIEGFGRNLPGSVKHKITLQFRTMSENKLRAFYEHGLFVLSAGNLADVVELGKVRAETVLIRGEKDTIVDLEDVYLLASKIPDCKVKIIENSGHFLHMEHEALFDIYREVIEAK